MPALETLLDKPLKLAPVVRKSLDMDTTNPFPAPGSEENKRESSDLKVMDRGVVYHLFEVYSRINTPGISEKRRNLLKAEEEWLIDLAENTGIAIPDDLENRAKRVQIHPVKK